LKDRYHSEADLSAGWEIDTCFGAVAEGSAWREIPGGAEEDLAAFSMRMTTKLFGDLSAACREVDPDHLNLGMRYYILPPDWLVPALRCLDVFSMNCYAEQILFDELADLHATIHRPVLIGEWHFGALDVGLPMAGICRLAAAPSRRKSTAAPGIFAEARAVAEQRVGNRREYGDHQVFCELIEF